MDEATYRLSGTVDLADQTEPRRSPPCRPPATCPMPAPMLLAAWWGDKFNRLYINAVKIPELKGVDVTVDLLPERRVATIENAWVRNRRSASRRRNSREGVPAALSRRAHRARFHREDSRRASPRATIAFC